MSLLPGNIHSAWSGFLTENIVGMLENIEKLLVGDFNPIKTKVLRFLQTDLNRMKIIVLGQDPYPEAGVATGRAFEVGTLKSWDMPFRQVSLKNFIRLIYKTQKGISDYDDIPTFSQISKEIINGEFGILNPPELFDDLEKQGVLFLNTSFTVDPGKPLSHKEIWHPFTRLLLSYISHSRPDINWFLWGKKAQEFRTSIMADLDISKAFDSHGKFYESRHPMMCSKTYSDDFLKSNCIEKTINIISWTGI